MTSRWNDAGSDDGGWRRYIYLASIWGVATWIVEVAVLPISSFGLATWWSVALLISLQWFVTGMGMAFFVMWAERYLGSTRLIVAAVVLALGWGVLIAIIAVPAACRAGHLKSLAVLFPGLESPCEAHHIMGTWAYIAWESLVIAATFTPVYVLSARAARTRSMLGRAEIARRQSEKAVEQARLQMLQTQIDPNFLSHVMEVIQDRYGHDPAAADRLLDRLVALLRNLMPGLRSQSSTLEAECAILRASALLQDELHPEPGAWKIDVQGDAIGRIPFPPLLLLPTIEELRGSGPRRPAWSVTARLNEGARRIVVQVARVGEPSVARMLEQRLLMGLRAAWGADAAIDVDVDACAATTTFTLRSNAARPVAMPNAVQIVPTARSTCEPAPIH
ncbi:histidine kinase [Variovorax sp. J22P271]|uniref:sensor histidine kinase n=1 Tax=Variovorax davisae TaxID=3053515 RepID=UPI002576A4C1|nr:sensor histidine kinase [Variovorax sp. J22P271]MDM0033509.1 histidine kinase [Variovorax sp. J22P271]